MAEVIDDIPDDFFYNGTIHRFLEEVFQSGSDRAAIICGVAMLDFQLEQILRIHLLGGVAVKDKDHLFDSNGPLANFSSRIKLCGCLKLLPGSAVNGLHKLREIRNTFAHDVEVPTLNDPPFSDKIKSLMANEDFRVLNRQVMNRVGVFPPPDDLSRADSPSQWIRCFIDNLTMILSYHISFITKPSEPKFIEVSEFGKTPE